jgi:prolipoprotein diacylglyceryl transferase
MTALAMTALAGHALAGALVLPASIPSPPQGVWHLGPFPLRAYALAILLGIVAAVILTRRRWVERGGVADDVLEIVFWAVPFGIVGGRIYHVVSSPDAYFGPGGHPWKAFAIWEGGLGIWGAIALGGVGAWIGCRRQGVRMPAFADAVAPGLLVAQAIGRLGNWFNQELFGGPTTLPWASFLGKPELFTPEAPSSLMRSIF